MRGSQPKIVASIIAALLGATMVATGLLLETLSLILCGVVCSMIAVGCIVAVKVTLNGATRAGGGRSAKAERRSIRETAHPEDAASAPGAAVKPHGAEVSEWVGYEAPPVSQGKASSQETAMPVATQATSEPVRIPASVDISVVLSALMESVAYAAPVSAHLWLADDTSNTLRFLGAVGMLQPSSHPIPLEEDEILTRAWQSGSVELGYVADIKANGRMVALWRYALPVTAGTARGVAALDLETNAGRPDVAQFPERIAPLRGSLAGALAVHVARTELETAEALMDSVRDLSRILDPGDVLDCILERALTISDGQTASIMLLDPESGRLSIARAHGLPDHVVRETSLAEGEGIAGWVFASRQSVLIEDVATRLNTGRRHGVRSAVSVLIADDDGVLGVLNVGSTSYPGRLTSSHCMALEILGRQGATALRNARAVVESRELYFDTLKALALAIETKDPFSAGGTERVLEYADAIAALLDVPEKERESICIAALVHDIGMCAAGEGVLLSGQPLSTVERALVRLHPKIAADMLAEMPALKHVVPIVYHHHEWYDGTGYVAGLAGERIPRGARILSVADAYVSMTSERPFRAAQTSNEAVAEILEKAGTQFDPLVANALARAVREETPDAARDNM